MGIACVNACLCECVGTVCGSVVLDVCVVCGHSMCAYEVCGGVFLWCMYVCMCACEGCAYMCGVCVQCVCVGCVVTVGKEQNDQEDSLLAQLPPPLS